MLYKGQRAAQAFTAEVLIHIPLHDRKERLLGLIMEFITAFEPRRGTLHRRFRLRVVIAVFTAFVESHNNIRAEVLFNLHRFFGGEEMLTSVDIRGKFYALVGDFVQFPKREYLKTAAIR